MGYQTDFMGRIDLKPALTQAQYEYLQAFAYTRRVQRDPHVVASLDDPKRHAVGLDVGLDGCFYVGSDAEGFRGQGGDISVVNGNRPPGGAYNGYFDAAGKEYGYGEERPASVQYRVNPNAATMEEGAQPDLWCQWIPTEELDALVWDEGEKFYGYVEWMAYLIHHFIKPWGITANGTIEWRGEDPQDIGAIVVKNNVVAVADFVISANLREV